MDPISAKLGTHYDQTFRDHGPSTEGVDWGTDPKRLELRYELMLNVASRAKDREWSLLDVGCGYGGLLKFVRERGYSPEYTGVDISQSMIEWANENISNAQFFYGDFLQWDTQKHFDFVVCNGILTQKLDTPTLEMDAFCGRLIRKMFESCRRGIAFNIMTTKCNFFSPNLYYRNPSEILSWCMSEITPHVKIDHSYPLYEFTTYLFRDPQ